MENFLYPHFFEIENEHWWFIARQKILWEVMEKKLQLPKGARLLDVGCGTGAILEMFSKKYETYGQDVSQQAIEFCGKRGLGNLFCGTLDQLPVPPNGFDIVTALDVIEHIEDDLGVLKQMSTLLSPTGRLVITVPAFPSLWSAHDIVTHHKRRYVKSTLRAVLTQAGFRVEHISYFNFFLFPVAAVRRMLARATHSRDARDLEVPRRSVNTILRWIFEAEKYILSLTSFPFGLSLLAFARKDETSTYSTP